MDRLNYLKSITVRNQCYTGSARVHVLLKNRGKTILHQIHMLLKTFCFGLELLATIANYVEFNLKALVLSGSHSLFLDSTLNFSKLGTHIHSYEEVICSYLFLNSRDGPMGTTNTHIHVKVYELLRALLLQALSLTRPLSYFCCTLCAPPHPPLLYGYLISGLQDYMQYRVKATI